jgi:hypothetical protein
MVLFGLFLWQWFIQMYLDHGNLCPLRVRLFLEGIIFFQIPIYVISMIYLHIYCYNSIDGVSVNIIIFMF